MRTPIRLFATIGALALSGGLALAQLPPLPTAGEQTAAQVFKNIQVLKDTPASELRPTMSFIATSLGVNCNFCHAVPDFASDEKPEKTTARHMMEMVIDINKNNFDGRPQVSCYTCHQGHTQPMSNPPVADEKPAPVAGAAGPGPGGGPGGGGPGGGPGGFAPGGGGRGPGRGGPPMPATTEVTDKYIAAIGGAAASNVKSARIEEQQGAGPQAATEVIEVEQPDKFMIATTRGDSTSKSGSDGGPVWSWDARRGTSEASPDQVTQLELEAQVYPGARLDAASARVLRQMPIGDDTAYMVVQRGAAGAQPIRYYFDTKTGLLLRIETGTTTDFGALPVRVDYSDYRPVDGVQIPFHEHWSTAERSWDVTVSSVKLNADIPAADFTAPPAKP